MMDSSYDFGTLTPNCCKCKSGRRVHTFQTVETSIAQLAQIEKGDGRWEVHSKINNIAISSVINEGVNVFCYTFASISSGFVKLVLNRITVIVS